MTEKNELIYILNHLKEVEKNKMLNFKRSNDNMNKRNNFNLTPGDVNMNIFETTVTFLSDSNKNVSIKSIYQDSLCNGSSIGTVVAVHGCPGSHKDFKYIEPLLTKIGIRLVGLNFPGFGLTESHNHLKHTNTERVRFVEAMLKILNINEKIIFIGHSRGSENALKMAALFKEHTIGAILVNPVGIKIHRGMKPTFFISVGAALWKMSTGMQYIISPIVKILYKNIGMRINSSQEAGTSLITIDNTDCEGQLKYIDIVNESNIIIINAIGGKDQLIEYPVSIDFGERFKGNIFITEDPKSKLQNGDDMVNSIIGKIKEGYTKFSAIFPDDGHYVQKYKAVFIANSISAILRRQT
uniref:AB hydrolase-1 domain-containing protein n=1 Tax=Strongyloides stercoralis TaxID=6248 RepID=A0AAF5CVG4_STRER